MPAIIEWSAKKAETLRGQPGRATFEAIESAILQGNIVADFAHPNAHKPEYRNQRVMVVVIGQKAYRVIYRETAKGLHLITNYRFIRGDPS